MSGEDHNFTVWGFIKGFGKLLIGLLLIIQGIIGLAVLLLFVGVMISVSDGLAGGKSGGASVPDDSALLMNPSGVLVEQGEPTDAFERALQDAYGIDEPPQVEVGQIVHAIREAKDDQRIKAMVLDFSGLSVPSSSASKLYEIADEIDAFRASGKEVIAVGDSYGQEQFLLAAHADKVFMHDFGNVFLYGYGSYGTYVKSLLEKLKITSHVFRVGTFKSAVEPYIRDDMSPEAKEANIAFLTVLWDEYARSVEKARKLPDGAIKQYTNQLGDLLKQAGGDFSKVALDYGLVDGLKSRPEQMAYLMDEFGKSKDGKSFKNVNFRHYLAAIGEEEDGDAPNVAIVTAAGVIVDGEAPVGQAAGGDTVAGFLKQALEDEDVKAVVLRVDSPGGSAFASEVIRDGVLALKAAGKPVVVSMGSLAASGGYWISSAADEIWASPTTITGSIGIFGFFTTFENTASEIGVYVDGVGTTPLSPIMATGVGPLPPEAADIIQQSVEEGYERFLTVVGEGRHLEPSYVDSVGQGRVWIGKTALDLKLVDQLGGIDEAVAAAAKRAGLEEYDVVRVLDRQTPFEKLFGSFSAKVVAAAGLDKGKVRSEQNAVRKLVREAEENVSFLDGFNDPNGLYARCVACDMK
ncbi:MAG: signal peptide peptidase SppA [Amphiplicatus sp.]|nr:signal peptide peptidase SppA [Amphiplicatus sp.]MCB9956047.1 signal peptide peptidase SppA [Caulobacterales bacterium]HRX37939.1 signal peptide peptidase SppA [Parvularculaceae bacterium]